MSEAQVQAVHRVAEGGIYGFFKEYRDLSNFALYPIQYEGLIYPSNENAYQALKSEHISDRETFTGITPAQAKRSGRLIDLRPDWEQIKLKIMYEINLAKFTFHSIPRTLLLSTKGKYLEETNWWKDRFWGVYEGVGENHLGRILMRIRDEI